MTVLTPRWQTEAVGPVHRQKKLYADHINMQTTFSTTV